MAEIASAFVSLLPSAKGFGRKLESEVGGDIKGAGKRMGTGFGKAFALAGGVVAAAGVVGFLGDSLGEARDAQKVGAQTTAVIKSTGGAAGITAKQVGDLATSISNKSGIDDEAIQSASNLLLTFTNLRNEVGKGNDIFNRATQIATDMGAALGTEPKAAAIQLGKALNDPIKGVSALSRVGVTFNDQQKKTIAGFVKTGDTAKAQKVILKELGKEFGGAAAAQATAGDKAAVAFGNLKESIGTALLPIVDRFATFLVKRGIPALQKFAGFVTDKIVPPLKVFANTLLRNLGPAFDHIRDALNKYLVPAFQKVGDFIKKNPTFVKAFAIALGILVVAIGAVTLATAAFSIALNSTGIPLVIIGIAALIAGLVVLYKKNADFRDIVNQVGAGLKSFAGFIKTNVIPVVVDVAKTIGEKAKPVLKQLGVTFRNDILPALKMIVAKFREAQPTIQKVIGVVIRLYGQFLKFYVTVLSKVLPIVIRFIGYVVRTAVPGIFGLIGSIKQSITKLIDFGKKVFNAGVKVADFAKKVAKKVAEVVTFFKQLPGKITSAIGNLGQLLIHAGEQVVQGLIDGITSKINALKDAAGSLAGKVKGFFPGSPVKEGPLKAWNRGNGASGGGQNIGDALAKGMEERTKKVRDRAKKLADAIKSQLDTVKENMHSLSQSIADAFRPDLFSGNLADFFSNGHQGTGVLRNVVAAFKKLRKFGLSEQFLSDLYSSGNSGLILDLASGDRATAQNAQHLFDQTNRLSNTLGHSVAGNQFGDDIDRLADRLEKALKRIPKETGHAVGREINHAATHAHRHKGAA